MGRAGSWAFFLITACGGGGSDPTPDATPQPQTPLATSGTRLKIAWDVAADGARAYVGLFDTQRAEACEPRDWGSGETLCTPPAPLVDLAYSDAACSSAPLTSGVGPYVSSSDGTQLHVYPVLAATVSGYYTRHGGQCYGPYNSSAFALGPELVPADLVALVDAPSTGSGRLRAHTWQSADGASVVHDADDTMLATRCTPTRDQTLDCAPETAYWAYYDSDASCSSPVAGIPVGAPQPMIVTGTMRAYFALGTAVASTALYGQTQGGCQHVAPAIPNQDYYALGTPLFAQPLAVTPRDGSTRLVPEDFTAEDFRATAMESSYNLETAAAMFDTVLGTECAFHAGVCMPTARVHRQATFADAACTQPLSVAYGATDTIASVASDSQALAGIDVVRMGAVHQGDVFVSLGGGCLKSGGAFSEIVETITDLATGTRVIGD